MEFLTLQRYSMHLTPFDVGSSGLLRLAGWNVRENERERVEVNPPASLLTNLLALFHSCRPRASKADHFRCSADRDVRIPLSGVHFVIPSTTGPVQHWSRITASKNAASPLPFSDNSEVPYLGGAVGRESAEAKAFPGKAVVLGASPLRCYYCNLLAKCACGYAFCVVCA
ncbi:hypothetical protein MRX96_024206 [Rhipicephalus microplus]